jgi:hypothetical protein
VLIPDGEFGVLWWWWISTILEPLRGRGVFGGVDGFATILKPLRGSGLYGMAEGEAAHGGMMASLVHGGLREMPGMTVLCNRRGLLLALFHILLLFSCIFKNFRRFAEIVK